MAWSFTNWLFAVGIACWCGLLSILHVRARAAGVSATSFSRSLRDFQRRLTACEELQNECALAISRIEARDKMRRVRAGVKAETPQPEIPPDSSGKLSDLSTAEIKRRLAMRIPLSEAKR